MLIHKLRLQHGWSQEQLAELSGLSARTIQRIEAGQKPSLESLKALGAVFNVDFLELKEQAMPETMTTTPASAPLQTDEILAIFKMRKIRKFYTHLLIYGIVMSGLVVFNLTTSPHKLWVIWPAMGWGFGLIINGLRAFNALPFYSAEWEKRKIETILGRKLS